MAVKLNGVYQLEKSNLLKQGLHLIIGTRHKPSGNKPKNYLLEKTAQKQHKYVSSLYPAPDTITRSESTQIWQFDYLGEDFLLTINQAENQAEIKPIGQVNNSTNSINNVELGSFNYPKADPDAAA